MKKLLTLFLAIALTTCLASCGGTQTSGLDFTIKDDTYGCTPQQVIDYFNTANKESEASALQIPDFVKSGENIVLNETPGFLFLTFKTSDSGNIKSIDFYFANANYDWSKDAVYSAGFYTSLLFTELLSQEDAERINAKISSALSTDNGLYVEDVSQTRVSINARDNVCLISIEAKG